MIAVENAVVVHIQPFGKAGFAAGLNLDMHKHPDFLPVVDPPDFHELVSITPAGLGFAHNLLERLVQRLVAARPVNLGRRLRKEKPHEWLEGYFKQVFPG